MRGLLLAAYALTLGLACWRREVSENEHGIETAKKVSFEAGFKQKVDGTVTVAKRTRALPCELRAVSVRIAFGAPRIAAQIAVRIDARIAGRIGVRISQTAERIAEWIANQAWCALRAVRSENEKGRTELPMNGQAYFESGNYFEEENDSSPSGSNRSSCGGCSSSSSSGSVLASSSFASGIAKIAAKIAARIAGADCAMHAITGIVFRGGVMGVDSASQDGERYKVQNNETQAPMYELQIEHEGKIDEVPGQFVVQTLMINKDMDYGATSTLGSSIGIFDGFRLFMNTIIGIISMAGGLSVCLGRLAVSIIHLFLKLVGVPLFYAGFGMIKIIKFLMELLGNPLLYVGIGMLGFISYAVFGNCIGAVQVAPAYAFDRYVPWREKKRIMKRIRKEIRNNGLKSQT